ncbi:MAG: hypothetical protein QOD83_3419 [Solirubrobacteraceae bacterium]|jgi:hypothetical protein|nr:hypothetical protein [Solirubrobacteraceae bacterium]
MIPKGLRLEAAGQGFLSGGDRLGQLPSIQTPLLTLRHILLIADG